MTPYAEVIGDPIGHSRSPAIHRFWLDRLGIRADYRATLVSGDGLAAFFADRRGAAEWRGCNITIPHKQAALLLVDEVDDGGIGAINCVLPRDGRLVGRNTDAGGFDSALPPEVGCGDRVVLIGAGGAAAAAVSALKARGAACDLLARKPAQGEALLERFGAEGRVLGIEEGANAIAGSAGIVNASPLGMNGFSAMPESLLAALDRVRSGGFVFDMVYAPLLTELLDTAKSAGLVAIDGLEMLIGQAALVFEDFFGAPAPRLHDSELRALLTS